jgi:phosphomannomutase / phosphoglucomutase
VTRNRNDTAASTSTRPQSHRLLIIVPAVLLLIGTVAGGLLTLRHVDHVSQAHTTRQHQAEAAALRDHVESQLALLRGQIAMLAHHRDTLAAIADGDAGARATQERRLRELTPHARRISLFTPGGAAVDLEAQPPVSFAALDLLHRAEAGRPAGPEAYHVGGEMVVYLAQPVVGVQDGTADGGSEDEVGGMLLAVLAMEYFRAPLRAFDPSRGRVEIAQRFGQGAAVPVLSHGDAPPDVEGIVHELALPHWQVVFYPGPATSVPLSRPVDALLPLVIFALLALVALVVAEFRPRTRTSPARAPALPASPTATRATNGDAPPARDGDTATQPPPDATGP